MRVYLILIMTLCSAYNGCCNVVDEEGIKSRQIKSCAAWRKRGSKNGL